MNEKIFQGLLGESLTHKLIDTEIDIYKKLIQDFKLEYDNKTAQIDNLLITSKGIYVIENKNWNGVVICDNNQKWHQVLSEKNVVNSPIYQNETHIKLLSSLLNKDISFFKSIIVFGYDTKINLMDNNFPCEIINIQNLIPTINNSILNCQETLISHEEIDEIYYKLKYLNLKK